MAAPEISCSFSKHAGSSQDPAPIISVPAQRGLTHNGFSTPGREEVIDNESSATSFTDQPIFFRLVLKKIKQRQTSQETAQLLVCLVTLYSPNREFRFISEVPIRLDYHGKHVSMEQVHSPNRIIIKTI